jgi:schlafen family protein
VNGTFQYDIREDSRLIDLPTTREEVQNLGDTKVQESLHLDYKASQALIGANRHGDIAKDVSAFANSDGGLIIYGVTEKDHIPIGIDSGVDHRRYRREWLEQVIRSNITPRIEDLRIAVAACKQRHVGSQTRGVFSSHSVPTSSGVGPQSLPMSPH